MITKLLGLSIRYRKINTYFLILVNESRILWRIFGPKKNENGEWRRFHNDELHSLYRSLNIVRVIKSKRLRWAGHVAQDGGR
jgi:hypothetical protein